MLRYFRIRFKFRRDICKCKNSSAWLTSSSQTQCRQLHCKVKQQLCIFSTVFSHKKNSLTKMFTHHVSGFILIWTHVIHGLKLFHIVVQNFKRYFSAILILILNHFDSALSSVNYTADLKLKLKSPRCYSIDTAKFL